MISDFCEFFRKIEEDPKKMIHGLKVRDMMAAREHISNCDDCNVRVSRVLSRHQQEEGFNLRIGMN